MNITEYIESGILERYVAGAVSDQERREVDCLSHIYPELKSELEQLQAAFEQYASAHEIAPPPALRQQILSKLEALSKAEAASPASQQPAPAASAAKWPIVVALAVGLIGGLALEKMLSNHAEQITHNQHVIEQMHIQKQTDSLRLLLLEKEMKQLRDPNIQKIALKGTPKDSSAHVTIFWNKATQETFLQVDRLPAIAADKQFQLWAIKDGKPVSIGLLPNQFAAVGLLPMGKIDGAQAFAITLEPQGGVASPTLSEMYVLGEV